MCVHEIYYSRRVDGRGCEKCVDMKKTQARWLVNLGTTGKGIKFRTVTIIK
jgi:hypothetical protein